MKARYYGQIVAGTLAFIAAVVGWTVASLMDRQPNGGLLAGNIICMLLLGQAYINTYRAGREWRECGALKRGFFLSGIGICLAVSSSGWYSLIHFDRAPHFALTYSWGSSFFLAIIGLLPVWAVGARAYDLVSPGKTETES